MEPRNPYLAPAAELVTARPAKPSPKSLKEAVWRGAKFGFKWSLYILGPFSLVAFLFTLGFLMYATINEDRRRMFADNPGFTIRLLIGPILGQFKFCLSGAILGGACGAAIHLLRGLRKVFQRQTL